MFDLIRFETTDLDHELFRKMGHKSSEKHCRVFSHRIKCGAEGFFFFVALDGSESTRCHLEPYGCFVDSMNNPGRTDHLDL